MTTHTAAQLGLIDRRTFVRIVRDDHVENTGEPMTLSVAAAVADRVTEAFYHSWEGAGPAAAVRGNLTTARYLATQWKGEDRRRIRAAIAEVAGLEA